jgi:hypothetical protein
MALRRYLASDVSGQIALRRKEIQEEPSVDFLSVLMLSESAVAYEVFQSIGIIQSASIPAVSSTTSLVSSTSGIPNLATAQRSHEHLPITALSCKCSFH